MLLQFHEYLSSLDSSTTLSTLPEQYYPLVVMLAQESPLQTSREIAKTIREKIKPTLMGNEKMAEIDLTGLATLVERLLERVWYGVTPRDLPILLSTSSTTTTTPDQSNEAPASPAPVDYAQVKIPPGMRLSRWEARDLSLVPLNQPSSRAGLREFFEQRRTVRQEARGIVMRILVEMPEMDRRAFLLGTMTIPASSPSVAGQSLGGDGDGHPPTSDPVMGDEITPKKRGRAARPEVSYERTCYPLTNVC